ncbi:MAG: PQQ-binding-like beta-propeller repeat protein [Candidatus Coatesbacteria bacterium]|nr:PQQ-binding-like beta-propeller repeat protein [Candidatus Coatesbacteria bacterium]
MKILLFFFLLYSTFSNSHPWPQWGHDARHTNRTDIIGRIPNDDITHSENKHYSPGFSALANINNKNYMIEYSWYWNNSSTGSSISLYNMNDNKYKGFFRNKFYDYDERLQMSNVCVDEDDLIYFTVTNELNESFLCAAELIENDSLRLYSMYIGPYYGPLSLGKKHLFVTHRDENDPDKSLYLAANRKNDLLKWSIYLDCGTYGSNAAIDENENAYVLTERHLFKLNTEGAICWKNPVKITFFEKPVLKIANQAPMISMHDKIIVNDEENLYAFNPEDGSIYWKVSNEGNAAPAEGKDGTIFATTSSSLKAFSPDGNLLWVNSCSNDGFPLTIDGANKIYIISNDMYKSKIKCFDSKRWKYGEGFWEYEYEYHSEGSAGEEWISECTYMRGQPVIIPDGRILCNTYHYEGYSWRGRYHGYDYSYGSGGHCIIKGTDTHSWDYNNICVTKKYDKKSNTNTRFSFNFYPNPARGKTSLKITTPSEDTIEIFNASGKRVFHHSLKTGTNYITWFQETPGIYIAKLKKAGVVKKLVNIGEKE